MAARGKKRKITADDVVAARDEHASVFDTSAANINVIAKRLGTTAAAVRQAMRESVKGFGDVAFERLAGRKAAADDPLSMLQAVFGPGPRGGAVNAREAAKELGVAPGTVRRWAAGTQKPSAGHLKKLQGAAKRATQSVRGRKRVTRTYRNSGKGAAATQFGGYVFVTGYQGPHVEKDREGKPNSYGSGRWRTVRMKVSPKDVDDLLDAYEKGLDTLKDVLTELYQREIAEWEFLTIDDFGIDV